MKFSDYLIKEADVNVEIDPNADQATTMAAVRHASRVAGRSPERYSREQARDAKEERRTAMQTAQDDPNSQLKIRIAKTKEQLAKLQAQLAAQERNNQAAV